MSRGGFEKIFFAFVWSGFWPYPLLRGCPSCEVLPRGAITANGIGLFEGEPLRTFEEVRQPLWGYIFGGNRDRISTPSTSVTIRYHIFRRLSILFLKFAEIFCWGSSPQLSFVVVAIQRGDGVADFAVFLHEAQDFGGGGEFAVVVILAIELAVDDVEVIALNEHWGDLLCFCVYIVPDEVSNKKDSNNYSHF